MYELCPQKYIFRYIETDGHMQTHQRHTDMNPQRHTDIHHQRHTKIHRHTHRDTYMHPQTHTETQRQMDKCRHKDT